MAPILTPSLTPSLTLPAPILIPGDLSIDDRGQVSFCNGFDFAGAPLLPPVRRFYLVRNHQPGLIRAWHAHQREHKYVLAVSGSALVAAVEVEDWLHPDPAAEVHRHVLSALRPAVLHIPAGYANGWMSLTADCQLLFFSTATLDESRADDYRFPARLWDPWKVEER